MNDISFDIARPQPARQPEAVSASLISDDNALDLASSLAGFIAPTMQKAEQTFLLSIELLKGMALDLAIAADDAYFTLAYTLIGASPDGGSTFALPRSVGSKMAMEIALLGERFDAVRAERLGLVNCVVSTASLEAETMKLATRLAQGPSTIYGRIKALLNSSLANTLENQLQREADALAQSAAEPDFAEGVRAFIEKRKPVFKGT
jgi:1,4-dihydroxy-2-naphthoyl-CoA synthase